MNTFSFFRYPASTVKPYKDITLWDAYRYITGTYAQQRTDTLRRITDPPQARQYKCSQVLTLMEKLKATDIKIKPYE